jgi:hypothetical protein
MALSEKNSLSVKVFPAKAGHRQPPPASLGEQKPWRRDHTGTQVCIQTFEGYTHKTSVSKTSSLQNVRFVNVIIGKYYKSSAF